MGKTQQPVPRTDAPEAEERDEVGFLAMQDFPPLATADGNDPRKVVLILRLARTQSGLTATEVAERMGVEPTVVSRFEDGCRASLRDAPPPNPSLDTLTKYATAVGKRLIVSLESAEPCPQPPPVL